jgi:hypothetical protein
MNPETIPPPVAPTPDAGGNPSYMDVIAEPEKSKGPKLFGIIPKKALLIAGGAIVLLIAIIVIVSIVNNINKSTNSQAITLGTKINELRVILGYTSNNPISNNVTATVAAETDIITASYFKEITGVYPAIDPEGYLDEVQVSIISELNSAKALGNLDNAYARALRDQLLAICDQIKILQESASDDQSAVLFRAYDDFQELANRLPVTDN